MCVCGGACVDIHFIILKPFFSSKHFWRGKKERADYACMETEDSNTLFYFWNSHVFHVCWIILVTWEKWGFFNRFKAGFSLSKMSFRYNQSMASFGQTNEWYLELSVIEHWSCSAYRWAADGQCWKWVARWSWILKSALRARSAKDFIHSPSQNANAK